MAKVNGEGKYMNGKPKTWKEPIKTNLYGQDVLYAMYYRATAM